MPFRLYPLLRRYAGAVRRRGIKCAAHESLRRLVLDPKELLPLSRINKPGLFTTNVEEIHAQEREKIRASTLLLDASKVQESYPHIFSFGGRILRYAFLPSRGKSKGLVVLFHGHNAFLHLGPMRAWPDYDLLAPWDNFGWQRQGSWFWGEKGVPFVEEMVAALIKTFRGKNPGLPWFCTGASMGGFAAMWHGIKYGCSGIYAICPQVDLTRKAKDFKADGANNPYRYLAVDAADEEEYPKLDSVALSADILPPLFIIQNLYDHVNPFAQHAWTLLDIYNSRRGWYGLRIHPSTGHGGDGQQEEAALFFDMIVERSPVFPALDETRKSDIIK
ncbi:hypothetical protein MTBLM1_40159 [Rhodospirillaceae bacterium LM-1]|nr:hypothetical protein MTBLM1_40159 [Rhodospirillaceae bacterium LM-1]